ncbi:MAG: hypothetical protein HY606_06195 [Planctomycetes bacterium]|nr:hypothetical protein [Planctomycetota bacterium]
MNIGKLMKKYERTTIISIVVLMVISLVVWVPMMPSSDTGKEAGNFIIEKKDEKKKITISGNEYANHRSRVFFHLYLRFLMPFIDEKYNTGEQPIISREFLMLLFQSIWGSQAAPKQKGKLVFTKEAKDEWAKINPQMQAMMKGDSEISEESPSLEQLQDKTVWENIVLLNLAKELNIEYTQDEFIAAIRGFVMTWYKEPGQQQQRFSMPMYTKQNYMRLLEQLFGPTVSGDPSSFEQSVKEYLTICNLLNKFVETSFPTVEEVILSHAVQPHKKIVYTSVNSNDVFHLLRPPTPVQIASYYARTKNAFKTQAYVELYYISIKYADNLHLVAQPTDEEIKKYFDTNKSDLEKEFGTSDYEKIKSRLLTKTWESKLRNNKDFTNTAYSFIWDLKKTLDGLEGFKKLYELKNKFNLAKSSEERLAIYKEIDATFTQVYPQIDEKVTILIRQYGEKKITVKRDLTIPFSKSDINRINNETFGNNTTIDTFCFGSPKTKGDFYEYNPYSERPPHIRTDRGFFTFMVTNKTDPVILPLTSQIAGFIKNEIIKFQIEDILDSVAKRLSDDLKQTTASNVMRMYPKFQFQWQDYFMGNNISIKQPANDEAIELIKRLEKIGDSSYISTSTDQYKSYLIASLVDTVVKPEEYADFTINSERRNLLQKKRILEKVSKKDTIMKISSLVDLVKR